ncbi:hypothetical protein OQA88_5896 [Cercophora sp. LCS_1]
MSSIAQPPNSLLNSYIRPPPLTLSAFQATPHKQGEPYLCQAYQGALAQSGLRTPPTDENMGTTYQMPNMASYENHHSIHHPGYAPTAASERPRPALNERPAPNGQPHNPTMQCYNQQAVLPQPRVSQSSSSPASVQQASNNLYQPQAQQQQPQQHAQPTQPQSPPRHPSTPNSGTAKDNPELSARDSAMVLHSLQIPVCISPKGGNLADFAAEVTALFWFESVQVLDTAEKIRTIPPGAPIRRIAESAKANRNFRKWVQSVLQTTQVTQNVILLALLFIYRLKLANASVKGRQGSEYRLFTVALMLGNKFLDDNTYTNKTWADVSGISVNEIHVMEVEFLSNMRYSLLVSKEQWEEWLVRLAKLHEFLERAQRAASPSPLLIPSPTHRGFASPLPSPTGTLQLTPQPVHTYSPTPTNHASSFGGASESGHSWNGSFAPNSAISPLALKPEPGVLLHKKRSFPEDDPTEPPAKRMSRVVPSQQQQQQYSLQMPTQPSPAATRPQVSSQVPSQRPAPMPSQQQPRPMPATAPDHTRLPVPNLTLNTAPTAVMPTQQFPAVTYAPPQASPLSLPPLVPGMRAMSTVFPIGSTTYPAPLNPVPSNCSGLPSHSTVVTPTTAFPPTNYGTPTKRLSPQNGLTPTAPYGNSSPLTDSFHHAGTPMGNAGSASGIHTPISHSPSIYLQQRNSPYKPVRHVNTLLHPPTSAFLQQYHFANNVPPAQMHYQPLGRRHELRTGIVPEFAMARAGHQASGLGQHPMSASYQVASQVLPNPNQARPSYAPQMGRPAPSNLSYN